MCLPFRGSCLPSGSRLLALEHNLLIVELRVYHLAALASCTANTIAEHE